MVGSGSALSASASFRRVMSFVLLAALLFSLVPPVQAAPASSGPDLLAGRPVVYVNSNQFSNPGNATDQDDMTFTSLWEFYHNYGLTFATPTANIGKIRIVVDDYNKMQNNGLIVFWTTDGMGQNNRWVTSNDCTMDVNLKNVYMISVTLGDSNVVSSVNPLKLYTIEAYGMAPDQVTGVDAQPADGAATVTWTASTDANLAGYNVYVDGAKVNTALITDTSYEAANLTNGQQYSFEVTASNGSNVESEKSEAAYATPLNPNPPATPAGFGGISGNGAVTLTWNGNTETDLKEYYILVNGVFRAVADAGATSYTVTGLTNGVSYSFAIYAHNTSNKDSDPTDEVQITPASKESKLSSLTLLGGNLVPDFDPNELHYTVNVTRETDHVNVTPVVAERYATVKVNGQPLTMTFMPGFPGFPGMPAIPGFPGTGLPPMPGTPDRIIGQQSDNINLPFGATTINVAVTAQDGVTVSNYVITVNRPGSTNADLSDLTVSSGDLQFQEDTTDYYLTVDNAVKQIIVTPEASDSNATIYVGDEAVESGGEASPISLTVGENNIGIRVVAEDGVTEQEYAIHVTRLPSSNASLDSLALSEGTLSPDFDPAVTSYTASVAHNIEGIQVTPVVSDYNSTVTVNGQALPPIAFGRTSETPPSVYVPLSEGANSIEVIVTAENRTTQTYTINAVRLALPLPAEITNLMESHTATTANFTFTLPTDPDFAAVNVYRNGNQVASVNTGEYEAQGLTPDTSYTFVFKAVNQSGVESTGLTSTFVTSSVPPVVVPPVEPPVVPPVVIPPTEPPVVVTPPSSGGSTTTAPTPTAPSTSTPKPFFNEKVNVDAIKTLIEKASSAPAVAFKDVPADSPAAKAIELATKLGIVKGYADGTFHANATVTRAEFAAMVVKALGLEASDHSNFKDTKGHWAANAIAILKASGIINGYEDGSFKPNQSISRAEIAAMLAKVMIAAPTSNDAAFSDVSGSWAKDAINKLSDSGIVKGAADGSFKPAANATRSESLLMILRMLNVSLDLSLDIE